MRPGTPGSLAWPERGPSIVLLLGMMFRKNKWSWEIFRLFMLAYDGILFVLGYANSQWVNVFGFNMPEV
jgi:hypothetical protein